MSTSSPIEAGTFANDPQVLFAILYLKNVTAPFPPGVYIYPFTNSRSAPPLNAAGVPDKEVQLSVDTVYL